MMASRIATGIILTCVASLVWAVPVARLVRVEPLALSSVAVPLDDSDPARRDVGRLRFMGGLVLRSTNAGFGGLSGLRAGPGGWFVGITDTGDWVTFRTVEAGGRLVGVTGGSIAPILDERGAPAPTKTAGDAEALEWDAAVGDATVSFEQDHRRQTYRGIDPARPDTLRASAIAVLRDAATATWPSNGGGEALAALPGSRTIVFAEEGQDATGASPVLIFGDATTRQLRYTPPRGFRPTDAQWLGGETLLVLNRRFNPVQGVAAALTLVTLPTDGTDLASTEIARLTPPLAVDNMEGLAVVRDAGRTFVYFVSDDNFRQLQRNLLLKFELLSCADSGAGAARGERRCR